ncbi:hypothetical protein [Sulfurovum sp.]|uniref:hypothetical protein n=1 Tax=Sulfurovum sp. TaxID=1969726 RepID=UPI003564B77D
MFKECFRMLRKIIHNEEELEERAAKIVKENIQREIEELENILAERKGRMESMKTIRTARTEAEINEAVEKGYKPLIQKVIPSDKIKVMYALERDLKTGKVTVLHDSWEIYAHHEDAERVIDKVYYYPYHFQSPFAAYLVPPDIEVGERVIIDDLIEDIVGARHKMHTYRLEKAEAVWNGEKFIVDHNSYNISVTMG